MQLQNPKKVLTLRALLISIIISLFLLASSSYIAMKLGALPWPIIFSVIVSGGLLKIFSRRNSPVTLHEINAAQAGASVGGLVSAGVVFTFPGIVLLQQQGIIINFPPFWHFAFIVAVAATLGVLLSIPMKDTFVEKEQLPYPAGTAGAALLKLGETGGRLLVGILVIGALAGAFALFRDLYFKSGWALESLIPFGIFITLNPSLLAVSGGYILGKRVGINWLAGAILGWIFIVPILQQSGFAVKDAIAATQNFGMGIVMGSGIAFFILYILPRAKDIFLPYFTHKRYRVFFPAFTILGIAALKILNVPLIAAIIAVLLTWIMVAVAARMTGETNINPLEQFGIFTGLIIAGFYAFFSMTLNIEASFIIVAFVSIACAVAGDIGHDFKSAAIIGTPFEHIIRIDFITALCSGLAAPLVFELIYRTFQHDFFTAAMPAPQAAMVAGSIRGFAHPFAFAGGFVLAFFAETILHFLADQYRRKIWLMPLGIGLFLGLGLALPLATGGLIRAYMDRRFPDKYTLVLLVAAGIMGGEGLAGFGIAGIVSVGAPFKESAQALISLFGLVALVSCAGLWYQSRSRGSHGMPK